MTPRERVETVLCGGRADRVPFTIYDGLLPRGEVEQQLRNDGVCVVARMEPFSVTVEGVAVEESHTDRDGTHYVRTRYETAEGQLSTVARTAGNAEETYHTERLFKGPEDYGALESLIRSRRYEPAYEAMGRAQETMRDSGVVVAELGYSPMHELMMSVMGLDRFAEEWAVRRDQVLRLYEALVEDRGRLYAVASGAPCLAVNYCGNVSAEVVGVERFEQYYVPNYDACAAVMHAAGKVVGVHFDANTWALTELIGATAIDYVEALTPRPDGDMTVAEARTDWHDKILWINVPYSLHLADPEEIGQALRQLMWEAAPGDRFMIGITEAVPGDSWQESFPAILRVINEDGALPISWGSPRQRAMETGSIER